MSKKMLKKGVDFCLVLLSLNDFHRLETETQGSYQVVSQYDDNGNKETLGYPSGKTIQKNYDSNNNLSEIYDGTDQIANLNYDRNRRLRFGHYGNNATLSIDYDSRGREISRVYSTPGADQFFKVDKSYDGQSNVATRDTVFNSTSLAEAFDYDHHDRLTDQDKNSAAYAAWQYDKNGNWEFTDQNGISETRTVNFDNEYATIDGTSVGYDDRGNMISDGVHEYTYDWANRLTQVSSGGVPLVAYTYDALNRRITRSVGTAVTTFIYDGQSIVEEYTNGSLDRVFVYADTLDNPVLVEVAGQDYYYVKDSQDSVKAVLDTDALLIESYDYNPFGLMAVFDDQGTDITGSGSTIGNPFGYTGRRWDNESGLWYYRNRMYSAELGRFMQRDPAGYVDGLNLYVYVLNNPLRYTDPDGLMARAAYDAGVDAIRWSTEKGAESAQWYADKYTETENPLYALGGGLASLWTPETYKETTAVLSVPLATSAVSNTIAWGGKALNVSKGTSLILEGGNLGMKTTTYIDIAFRALTGQDITVGNTANSMVTGYFSGASSMSASMQVSRAANFFNQKLSSATRLLGEAVFAATGVATGKGLGNVVEGKRGVDVLDNVGTTFAMSSIANIGYSLRGSHLPNNYSYDQLQYNFAPSITNSSGRTMQRAVMATEAIGDTTGYVFDALYK